MDNEYDENKTTTSRQSGSKIGFATKFLLVSLLVGVLAIAGLSLGIGDYSKLVGPDTIKVSILVVVDASDVVVVVDVEVIIVVVCSMCSCISSSCRFCSCMSICCMRSTCYSSS